MVEAGNSLRGATLVAIPSLKQEVAVGQSASVRVPLYDKEVFPEGVPQLRQFYNSDLSRCMHEALYTGLAQALRVRRVGKLVELLEKQSLQDQAKVAVWVRRLQRPTERKLQAGGLLPRRARSLCLPGGGGNNRGLQGATLQRKPGGHSIVKTGGSGGAVCGHRGPRDPAPQRWGEPYGHCGTRRCPCDRR